MKDREVIEVLGKIKLPDIELGSHRRRLKMALLDGGYSRNEAKETSLETVRIRKARGFLDAAGPFNRRPAWKIVTTGVLALLIVAAMWISIPQASSRFKAAFFPEGSRTISGTQLNVDEQRVSDILMADPRIKELLAQGAVIDKILPIEVAAEMLNPETGKPEVVKETCAQAWLVLGSKDWGVQVDLVKGQIVSITE